LSSSTPFSSKRLLTLAKPQSKLLGGAFATLTITSSVTLAFPYVTGQIIDASLNSTASVDPTLAAATLFSMVCAAGAGVVARQILLTKAGENIVADLRHKTFESILKQENSFFDQTRTGDLVTRLTADVQLVQSAVTTEILNGVRAVIMSTGGIGFLFYTSPTLTGVSLLSLPPIFLSAKYFGAQIKSIQKHVQEDLALTTTKAEEVIANIKTVRSFNGEEFESELYKKRTEQVRERAIAAGIKGAFLDGSVHVAANAGLLGILAVGGNMVGVGGGEALITPGELASFLMYSIFVAGNVSALSTVYGSLQKSSGAAERIYELIDRAPEVISGPGTSSQEFEEGRAGGGLHINFEDVSFSYPTRAGFPVLTNLNLEFPKGSHTAIVGASGSGKSTLAQVLLRLYDVNSGKIKISGVDVREMELTALRNSISIVQQEPVLFSSSIEENIRYGSDRHVSKEKVWEAARAANVLDFALGFPEGMDTLVGEKGVQLSGGQKQRVACARVLLRDSPIVVFDEATSALDAESEYSVTQAIEEMVKGRTVISIAHRLSTIRKADRIAVLENGSIVEVGETADMLGKGAGRFETLIKRQRTN
jgi:ABC-type multidrug transport system fused ATPase/permease subunit